MPEKRRAERKVVRVESPDTACGSVPHMTVDEIVRRLYATGDRELRCPACGKIHLSEEDVKEAEAMRYSKTKRFREIEEETEGKK